jgi:hypothetical protein
MVSNIEKDFEKNIADILRKENIRLQTDVVLGGIQTDFFIETPSGRRIVAEVKGWEPTQKNRERAIRLAHHFKNITKADHSFIIIPDLKKGVPSKGLVTAQELPAIIQEIIEKRMPAQKRKGKIPFKTEKKIFAAMPFKTEYYDVFYVAVTYAAEAVNAKATRIDKDEFVGDIVEEIKKNIRESIAVIADLSDSNPNVFYEVGYSHGTNVPTVLICSTPLDNLPFDVRNWNIIKYNKGQTHELKYRLKKRLEGILGN